MKAATIIGILLAAAGLSAGGIDVVLTVAGGIGEVIGGIGDVIGGAGIGTGIGVGVIIGGGIKLIGDLTVKPRPKPVTGEPRPKPVNGEPTTKPVPGRRCPNCLSRGQTVWVIPGKRCPVCHTHVS